MVSKHTLSDMLKSSY